ncbi:MAG: DUF5063 domain-containing protein [Bacteroidales bacterium]|jgi:hypothetical protein|nr:DUF5063 domain-containing protein [Bacteroidales bacterium]
MNKIEELIAPQTKKIVLSCRKYFEYVEVLPDKQIEHFWSVQLKMLSDIYRGMLVLPEIETRYSSDVDKFVTEKAYNKVLAGLTAYIGALDKFPDFTDMNTAGVMKATEASLSEMLTDIYQELKDFVLLYETETLENMNDAIAECEDSFGRYWGVKLLSALRIIHVNLYQQRYAVSKKSDDLEINIEEVIGDYNGEEEE